MKGTSVGCAASAGADVPASRRPSVPIVGVQMSDRDKGAGLETRRAVTGRCDSIPAVETRRPAPNHGSHSTYTNWGCRCRACKDANAAYGRRRRAQRRQKTRDNGGIAPVAKHGSATTYTNWGCQCAPCLADHNRRERAAEAKRQQGATS